jgi:UPF0716 family protein affecting phage T7 exclusion
VSGFQTKVLGLALFLPLLNTAFGERPTIIELRINNAMA